MINTIEKTYSTYGEYIGYKITYVNDKILYVPLDEANTDYQAIQEWAAIEGNNIIDPGA
jgi:hypothetical protein